MGVSWLVIDTASSDCRVGLLRSSDRRLFSNIESAAQSHSRCILSMIDTLLTQASTPLPTIQALVWNAGPGSFTGIRIAASVVQSLSYSLQIPFLSLSSLEIMAYAAAHKESGPLPICVALDARMNGIYWASFSIENGVLSRTEEDRLVVKEEFEKHCCMVDRTILLVGDAWPSVMQPTDSNTALEDLIALARLKQQQDWQNTAASCLPNYVQSTVGWQKRTRVRAVE